MTVEAVAVAQSEAGPRSLRMRRVLGPPLLVWFASRLAGLAVFALVARARDRSLLAALTSWDGKRFLAIAERGYPTTSLVAPDPDLSMAFFPGYPLAIRAVARLTGMGDVAAGFVITAVSGASLALGLVALAREIGLDRRAGLLWIALVGASPLSVVFLMTYTEPPFCALAIWALVAVTRRQWPAAALLAVAAGLFRPTAAAIIVVVMVGALLGGC